MQSTVLVIGSGVAGLTYALKAAEFSSVTLITKKENTESNTNYAQGGIAAVMSADDSPDLHIQDTLTAGAGLCHRDAVEQMVREGPGRVRELMDWGAQFSTDTADAGRWRAGSEPGPGGRSLPTPDHPRERPYRPGGGADSGGRSAAAPQHPPPRAPFRSGANCRESGWAAHRPGGHGPRHPQRYGYTTLADATVLASGGAGHVYLHTTNPPYRHGGRGGDRVSRGRAHRKHGVHPVPSHPRSTIRRGARSSSRKPSGRGRES
jgi:L-aspartate oxidase